MLKATASFGLAGFLAFDHSRVACQETVFAEGLAEIRLKLNEGAGNAQLDGAGLTRNAASLDGDKKIKRVGVARVVKRRGRFGAGADMAAEKIHEGFVIDDELAGALFDADAGDAFFASTG